MRSWARRVRASFLGSDRNLWRQAGVARHAGGRRVVWTASDRAFDAANRLSKPVRDGVDCRPIWVSGRSPPSLPIALDRSFEAPAPNRKWIADFTYVWTAEGLALCGRRR